MRSTARPFPGSDAGFAVHVDLNSARMRLSGKLDGRTAPLLHDAVSLLLLNSGEKSWLFEVAGLEVDRAGLRALAGVYRRTLRQGRRLALYGASPQLERDLVRLRLASHLLVPSPATAVC